MPDQWWCRLMAWWWPSEHHPAKQTYFVQQTHLPTCIFLRFGQVSSELRPSNKAPGSPLWTLWRLPKWLDGASALLRSHATLSPSITNGPTSPQNKLQPINPVCAYTCAFHLWLAELQWSYVFRTVPVPLAQHNCGYSAAWILTFGDSCDVASLNFLSFVIHATQGHEFVP